MSNGGRGALYRGRANPCWEIDPDESAPKAWRSVLRSCDSGLVSEAGRDGHLRVRDIEGLQALMRGSAPAQRSEAVARLRSLRGTILDADVARAALRAAGVSYPWVPGVPDDTSELFVHLLWGDPTVVEVTELERSYMFCAERGRRAVLRTMALRADRAGLDAVVYLLDADGAQESLPAPSSGLLSPLLAVEGVDRLAPKLISLVLRRGWSDHAAEMIIAMCQRGLARHHACRRSHHIAVACCVRTDRRV